MAEVKKGILDELKDRGIVKQVVFEDDLKAMLDSGPQSFYIGFDPTADSLHVGHFMQMIVAKRLQDAGHRPIILIDQKPLFSPQDILYVSYVSLNNCSVLKCLKTIWR